MIELVAAGAALASRALLQAADVALTAVGAILWFNQRGKGGPSATGCPARRPKSL